MAASPLLSSPLLASSTPLLTNATSLRNSTPRYSLLPLNLSQSLFSSPDDEGDVTVIPTAKTEDPLPSTQALAEKLADLRQVNAESATTATTTITRLLADLDDLKSEVVALRLEVVELRQENANLRAPHLPLIPPSSSAATAAQPPPQLLPPPPPPDDDDDAAFTLVESRRQRQRRKQDETAAATAAAAAPSAAATTAAATTTAAAAASTTPPTISSTTPVITADASSIPANNVNIHTIHVFHDSNLTCSPDNLLKEYQNIIQKTKRNKPTDIQFNLIPTYTLPATRNAIRSGTFIDKEDKIQTITFKHTDTVIIHILTNDARQTKHRNARTTTTTFSLQSNIIRLLRAHLPPSHITFIEAPPLLSSSTSDIFPYNAATYDAAVSHGAKFAPTLVGEEHLWRDGFHINHRHRHFLLKTIAAAAVSILPHPHYGLRRPPFGEYGPWISPRGRGMTPPPSMDGRSRGPSHRDVAVAAPYQFRRQKKQPLARVPPLMNRNILPLR